MTPHSPTPGPDGFPPELLAAYADGELDAETRAAVERWLADHPEALAELNAQRAFSPVNAELWEQVEPPEPSADAWGAARRGIENSLAVTEPVARPGRSWRVAALFATCAAALAGLVGVGMAIGWLTERPKPQLPGPQPAPVEVVRGPDPAAVAPAPRAIPAPSRPDPLAGFAVLPMATDDDVILHRVPDTGTGWLPVGRHPLPDALVLASLEEVELQEVEPSPVWPTGGPKMTTAPGDAPMIFAFKRR